MKIQIGPEQLEERTSDFEYEGYNFKLISTDPYGFIRVFSIKEKKYLDEQFTGNADAKRGVMKYVHGLLTKKDKK